MMKSDAGKQKRNNDGWMKLGEKRRQRKERKGEEKWRGGDKME